MGGKKITNTVMTDANGTSSEVANKNYVDAKIGAMKAPYSFSGGTIEAGVTATVAFGQNAAIGFSGFDTNPSGSYTTARRNAYSVTFMSDGSHNVCSGNYTLLLGVSNLGNNLVENAYRKFGGCSMSVADTNTANPKLKIFSTTNTSNVYEFKITPL